MGVVDRVTRVGMFGATVGGALVAAAVAGSSAGCNVREQMPSRRLARQYTPPATRPAVDAPVVTQDLVTSTQMETLPAGVRTQFATAHPAAAVTKVTPVLTGGLMNYRVAYVEAGVVGSDTFTAAGASPSADEAVVLRPDDSGRPKAKYAPKTEAGIPAKGTPSGKVD